MPVEGPETQRDIQLFAELMNAERRFSFVRERRRPEAWRGAYKPTETQLSYSKPRLVRFFKGEKGCET